MRNTVIDLYTITTLTNLHAGRGDSNYGIVDNEVQRDPVDEYPVIFASSLKGAFRQLFDDTGAKKEVIEFIFGNEVRNNGTIKPGKYTFHEARLVSLPVRSPVVPFLHGTTAEILKGVLGHFAFISGLKLSELKGFDNLSFAEVNPGHPKASMEGEVDEFTASRLPDTELKPIQELQGTLFLPDGEIALFHTKDFKSVTERLPVIARNQLEDGVSKNLFYEEVVPRQSRFAFLVERPADQDLFYKHLEEQNLRVQIGGNASIGYGVCQLQRIPVTKKS